MSKSLTVEERVANLNKIYEGGYMKYGFSLADVSEEFWKLFGPLTIHVGDNSVLLESEELPLYIRASYEGDCCSYTYLNHITGESAEHLRVTFVTSDVDHSSSAFGSDATRHILHLSGGGVFEFEDINENNGYYGTCERAYFDNA